MQINLDDCTQPTSDGHLLWTGPVRTDGGPIIYLTQKRHRSVLIIAFTADRHREPVGKVKSTCHVPLCIAPAHLADHPERQAAYIKVAEANGMATDEGYCEKGHAWAEHARFVPGGYRSCEACRLGHPPIRHGISIELALDGILEDLSRHDEHETVRRAICERGATHKQAAHLISRSPRTVSRWASRHQWRKPVSC
jgi:hypothetical protein